MPCTTCGNIHIENRDLQLCHSCNKARRKEPKKQKPRKKINQMSQKTARRKREMQQAQKQMRDLNIRYCQSCGRTDRPISHSHIIPEGAYPQHSANPANMMYECYGDSDCCHDIWERGTIQQKMQMPTWREKINLISLLEPAYLSRLMLKA
jgi:hypothetical protein